MTRTAKFHSHAPTIPLQSISLISHAIESPRKTLSPEGSPVVGLPRQKTNDQARQSAPIDRQPQKMEDPWTLRNLTCLSRGFTHKTRDMVSGRRSDASLNGLVTKRKNMG